MSWCSVTAALLLVGEHAFDRLYRTAADLGKHPFAELLRELALDPNGRSWHGSREQTFVSEPGHTPWR